MKRHSKLVIIVAGVAICMFHPILSVTAQTSHATLLVLNQIESTLQIVDPSSMKVLNSIPTGEHPHEVAVSDDGKFAFVSIYNGPQSTFGKISVVDLNTQKIVRNVDLGALHGSHGLVFADGKLYFTVEGSKAIGRYDPSTNQVDWVLGIGQDRSHMLALSKDRNRIFTSNVNSDSITEIEKSSGVNGWEETVIPAGKGPEGFDLSPDEKEIWAANSGDGSVSIIDTASKKAVQTFDVATKHSSRLKFTPDGKLVLISDGGDGNLVIITTADRKVIKRIKLGGSAAGILVTPDGLHAYISAGRDDKVAVVDLKTLEITSQIAVGKGPDGLAWAVAH